MKETAAVQAGKYDREGHGTKDIYMTIICHIYGNIGCKGVLLAISYQNRVPVKDNALIMQSKLLHRRYLHSVRVNAKDH